MVIRTTVLEKIKMKVIKIFGKHQNYLINVYFIKTKVSEILKFLLQMVKLIVNL